MAGELAGKVVVVTGAGAGLGRAYARACAAAGAAVVVNDVRDDAVAAVVEEIESSGGRARGHVGSVAEWDAAGELIDVADGLGGLDGLVANAGVYHLRRPWEETEESLRRIVEVNVLGVLFCGVRAIRSMRDRGRGGAIVTVTSGARLGLGRMSAYGTTKGAVAAATAGWALDCAEAGIRVNAVSPLADTAMAALNDSPDRAALGRPDEVAPVVVALLSELTAGMTGRIVRFDGTGLHLYTGEGLAELDLTGARSARALAERLAAV